MALVDYLKEGGPNKVHNVDNLLLRESMDVIGARPCLALLRKGSHGSRPGRIWGMLHSDQGTGGCCVQHCKAEHVDMRSSLSKGFSIYVACGGSSPNLVAPDESYESLWSQTLQVTDACIDLMPLLQLGDICRTSEEHASLPLTSLPNDHCAGCGCAGRFGFQKEMNALHSLRTGNAEETEAVASLLGSTHEIERRIQEVYRWWRLWLPDVRAGWGMLGRFQVRD